MKVNLKLVTTLILSVPLTTACLINSRGGVDNENRWESVTDGALYDKETVSVTGNTVTAWLKMQPSLVNQTELDGKTISEYKAMFAFDCKNRTQTIKSAAVLFSDGSNKIIENNTQTPDAIMPESGNEKIEKYLCNKYL